MKSLTREELQRKCSHVCGQYSLFIVALKGLEDQSKCDPDTKVFKAFFLHYLKYRKRNKIQHTSLHFPSKKTTNIKVLALPMSELTRGLMEDEAIRAAVLNLPQGPPKTTGKYIDLYYSSEQ